MSSLILLAGNRQSDIDRAHAENAYHHVDEVNAKQDEQLVMLAEQNALSIAQHERLIASLTAIIDGLNEGPGAEHENHHAWCGAPSIDDLQISEDSVQPHRKS